MRTEKEIKKELESWKHFSFSDDLIVELLLDIRKLLQKKNKGEAVL